MEVVWSQSGDTFIHQQTESTKIIWSSKLWPTNRSEAVIKHILWRSFISRPNLSDEGVKCARPGLACCSHLQLSSLQSLNPSFHQSQKWISARIMITISYNWTSYSALSRYSVQQLRRQVMIITLSLHCGSITVWRERIYFAGLAAAGPDRLTPIRVWAR